MLRLAATLILVAVIAAACGGGDEDEGRSDEPPPTTAAQGSPPSNAPAGPVRAFVATADRGVEEAATLFAEWRRICQDNPCRRRVSNELDASIDRSVTRLQERALNIESECIRSYPNVYEEALDTFRNLVSRGPKRVAERAEGVNREIQGNLAGAGATLNTCIGGRP